MNNCKNHVVIYLYKINKSSFNYKMETIWVFGYVFFCWIWTWSRYYYISIALFKTQRYYECCL